MFPQQPGQKVAVPRVERVSMTYFPQQCSSYQWIERVPVVDGFLHAQLSVSYMWIAWIVHSGVVCVSLAGSGWLSPAGDRVMHPQMSLEIAISPAEYL